MHSGRFVVALAIFETTASTLPSAATATGSKNHLLKTHKSEHLDIVEVQPNVIRRRASATSKWSSFAFHVQHSNVSGL